MVDAETLRLGMSAVLFLLGLICFIAGLRLIFAGEYRNGMKELVTQSAKVSRRAVTENSVAPIIDATSRLIESVAQLVRTAFGMGAFLCLLGLVLCVVAIWIIGVSI